MNDPLPPLTDDDLSAHLDGEVGPDVAARIAADPAAQARLEELRAASEALHDAPVAALDASVVDGLIAQALAATGTDAGDGDAIGGDGEHGDGDAVVAPLRTRSRANPQWLVAAVVLVLVAAGLALVWSGTRASQSDDTATSAALDRQADEAAPESAADGGGTGAGSAAGGDTTADGDGASSAPTTLDADAGLAYEGAPLPDLGTFETSELLRSSLATAFPADAAPGTATSSGSEPITTAAVDRCAGLLREVLPVEGDPNHVGVARVGQETVLVYEFTATPDASATTSTIAGTPATTLTTAVRPAACDPLFVFQR